jgi:hypothetical protein
MGLGVPMTATELEEVQSLLERVLPDPRGFAGRLLEQAITQYGQFAPRAAATYYAAATAEDITPADTIIVADEWTTEGPPADIGVLLAAALGACECWGLLADCDLCQGHGSAGWTQPDSDLFEEFVRPAVDRLPPRRAGSHRQRDRKAAENRRNHQGEKT